MHRNSKTAQIRQTQCEKIKNQGTRQHVSPNGRKKCSPKISAKPSLPIGLETENFVTQSRAQNKPTGHAAIQRDNAVT
jgi:hypothetical protein